MHHCKIKATPHRDCASDSEHNFLSDRQNRRRNTDVFQGDFGENDGKFAGRWRAKPTGGLCAVLP